MRLALGLQRIERKGHVRIFVVHDRTDHATRQVVGLVAELLACLVELLADVGRRSAVAQDHHREGQARPREGLGPVVPAELLHPLLQLLGDLLFHLLRRGPGPSRHDRHLLDGERGIFRPAEPQEGHDPGDGDRHDQEQGDGALAYGEGGEIEVAHGRPSPSIAARCATAPSASRTDSLSCSRCAPSATMRSPGSSSPTTAAASSPSPATRTARQVTRGVSPSTCHTPGPLPASKIAPIGTCNVGAESPAGIWIETVEPSGARPLDSRTTAGPDGARLNGLWVRQACGASPHALAPLRRDRTATAGPSVYPRPF